VEPAESEALKYQRGQAEAKTKAVAEYLKSKGYTKEDVAGMDIHTLNEHIRDAAKAQGKVYQPSLAIKKIGSLRRTHDEFKANLLDEF
jgi:hypothetical protein